MIRKGLKLVHPELAEGRWAEMPFALQMGNIGGEVSRAVNAKKTGECFPGGDGGGAND